MSCFGVLFAIEHAESEMLKNFKNDTEMVEYIKENIEANWDEKWLCETDKAWDTIHRCFADGKLELYSKITEDYQRELNDEDFEYTWEWFEIIKEYYVNVAKTNRDVIFTVDQ